MLFVLSFRLSFASVLHTWHWLDGHRTEVSCLEAATAEALKAGYRHLDVAEGYTTGTFVKNAVASSGVAREELWVTGKLTGLPCESSFEDTKQRAAALLGRLGLEYFDLLLMHFPGPSHMDVGAPPSDQKSVATAAFCRENMAVAWANMLRLLDAGMCRRIGVSNFYPFHIDLLLKVAKDTAVPVPFANQVGRDRCESVHAQARVRVRFCLSNAAIPLHVTR